MTTLECPDCGKSIAMHELETRTVAQSEGFETSYQCPYCGTGIEDVAGLL